MKAVLIALILMMTLCCFEIWQLNESSEKIIIKNNYIEKGKVVSTKVFTANLYKDCKQTISQIKQKH